MMRKFKLVLVEGKFVRLPKTMTLSAVSRKRLLLQYFKGMFAK